MSSQGRREESLIRDLDAIYGSIAPPTATGWKCKVCDAWHLVPAGQPLRCPMYPPVVADGRHLMKQD